MPFADIHAAMAHVMRAAKRDYGAAWPPRASSRWPERRAMLCDDGIHPDLAAHIPMAHALLRTLGFDGDIGTIDLDWAAGTVATDIGQKAKVGARGHVEIESTRLPLCFFDDSAAGGGYPSVPCRYVLASCPFEQDLNRYLLRVRGLPNQPIRVAWGDRKQIFTREQLEAGLNLAAEFPENPFCPTMRALDAAVWRKQVFERAMFMIFNPAVWDQHFAGTKPDVRKELLRKDLAEFMRWAKIEFSSDPGFVAACEHICAGSLETGKAIAPADWETVRRCALRPPARASRKRAGPAPTGSPRHHDRAGLLTPRFEPRRKTRAAANERSSIRIILPLLAGGASNLLKYSVSC